MTSSENLVASAQFLDALATSEAQFPALAHSDYVDKFISSCYNIFYLFVIFCCVVISDSNY